MVTETCSQCHHLRCSAPLLATILAMLDIGETHDFDELIVSRPEYLLLLPLGPLVGLACASYSR